jgi:ribosome-binding factor A
MAGYRKRRVSDEIKRIIGEIFIKDLPSDGSGLITVTNVRVSGDLRQAKIYLSIYNEDPAQRQIVLKNIKKKKSYIRGLFGNRINMKFIPELYFFEDDTMAYADSIERLLQSIHKNEKDDNSKTA